MTDDTLLKSLAAEARAQENNPDGDEQLWERYAMGELSDEELEALVSRTPPEEVERMKAVYAPLDQEFKNQLAGSVKQQLVSEESVSPQVNASADVVPLHSHRSKLFAPFALAATLLLALGTWQFGLGSPEYAEVPAYTMAVIGGSRYRSTQASDELPSFGDGDRLDIRLTPATTVDHEIQSAVFVLKAEALTPLSGISAERAPSGAVRMRGRIGETVVLQAGAQELVIVLSSDGRQPQTRIILKAIKQAPLAEKLEGSGWQAWRSRIYIDDGG